MSAPALTVCLCTHNPRPVSLERTLAALAAQTLTPASWECLIIDNASNPPLRERLDPRDFPNAARIIEEPVLGLTPARRRAIGEAAGEVLVFVDDDNVLAPDYLETALRLMTGEPALGACGGRCRGEYVAPPPTWARFYLPYLAVIDHGAAPKVTGGPHQERRIPVYEPWFPCGAGLVIRRELARRYAAELASAAGRLRLGRRGASLSSGEDIDMLLTVLDAGAAVGWFPELTLTHLIPPQRLTFGYLWRMVYAANHSLTTLLALRGAPRPPRPWPLGEAATLATALRHGQWHPLTLALALQIPRARRQALREVAAAEQ